MIAVPVTQLGPGQAGTVSNIEGDFASSRRLFELGLVAGTPVQFIRRAPLGDPIELDIAGSRFSLRREVARLIAVFPGSPL